MDVRSNQKSKVVYSLNHDHIRHQFHLTATQLPKFDLALLVYQSCTHMPTVIIEKCYNT
jgi:hypothetical protein